MSYMKGYSVRMRDEAAALRRRGKTYSEINETLGRNVPKATLAYWFRDISIPVMAKQKQEQKNRTHLRRIQGLAVRAKRAKRLKYLEEMIKQNKHLAIVSRNRDIQKIILSILYLGEGRKNPKTGSLAFGNANPEVIGLFLQLLRSCYKVREDRLRVTVMCRADQDRHDLNAFWSDTTKISLNQFYPVRIDSRTIGKATRKVGYRGVCRIEYFSARVLHEILIGSKVIVAGLLDSKIDIKEFFRNS